MNKKLFVLLPAAMMLLAACDGGGTSDTTPSSTTPPTTDTGGTTTTTPDVDPDYGTETNPLSVETLLENVARLVDPIQEAFSIKPFFVTGFADGNSLMGANYLDPIYLKDDLTDDVSVKVTKALLGESSGVENVGEGDKLVVTGYAEYYNGSYSLYGAVEDEAHPNPLVLSSLRGESTVTTTHDDHSSFTSTVPETATNGSTIEVEVAADTGYRIDKVTCNGATVEADDSGKYSCYVLGPTEIAVASILDIEEVDVPEGTYTVAVTNLNSGLSASAGNVTTSLPIKADEATVIYKKMVVDFTSCRNQDNYGEVTIDKGGKMVITTPTGKIKSIKADWYISQSCDVRAGSETTSPIAGTDATMAGSKGLVKSYAINNSVAILSVQEGAPYTQSFYKLEVEIENLRAVDSIAVQTAPTKLSYTVGSSFDPTGLVIRATFEDGDTQDIPYVGHESEFTFAPSSNLQVSDSEVVVTWREKTTTVAITVEDVAATQVVCGTSASTVQVGSSVTLSATYNGSHSGTTTFEVVTSGTTGEATIEGDTLTGVAIGDVYVKAISSAPALESEPIKIEVTAAKSSMQIAYEAAAALSKGGTTSQAYTFEGVVIGLCGSSYFVQDGEYGMYVYNKALTGNAVGKIVSVTATLTNYNGCLETKNVTNAEIKGDGVLPEAVTVTSLAQLQAINQNILVNVVVGMPANLGAWSSSNSPLVNGAQLGSDTVTVKFDKYGYSEEQGAIYAASANQNLTINGIIPTAYDSSTGAPTCNQFLVIGTSELSLPTPPEA